MRSLAIICTIILVAGCSAPKMASYSVPKSPSVLGRLSVPVECISIEEFEALHGYFIDIHNTKTD